MQSAAPRGRTGFAIAYVVIILAVLFALAFILIQSFRHEAAFSFKHLEKTVAQCAAELGVEHGLYILQQHKANDYKTLGIQKSSLEINKKFGTQDEFEMDIPTNCTDDEMYPLLAGVDMNASLADLKNRFKLDYTPRIESLKILYKTLDTIDPSPERLLKFGRLTVKCTASYGGSKVTVESLRRVEIYRTLMIAPDWQFAVTAGTPQQRLVGRRSTTGIFSSTNLIAQFLFVNNGWPSSSTPETVDPVVAKIFGKNLLIELNDHIPDFGAFSMMPVMPGGFLMGMTEGCDMMFKLTSDKVDPKAPENPDSKLYKYRANKFLGFNIDNFIDTRDGSVVEWDVDKMKNILTTVFSAFTNGGKGGTRGNIDLTGLPGNPDAWSASVFTNLTNFLGNLFGKRQKFARNELHGQIKRKYGYYEKSTLQSLFGWVPLLNQLSKCFQGAPEISDTETYVFSMNGAGPADSEFRPYAPEVYRRMAGHGHGRLYVTPKDFSDHRLQAGAFLWWKDIGAKDFNNVCWFFGYADSYEKMEEQGWKIFHWWPDRNAFEATRLDSRLALQVNGVHFVDGNAFVEGYYKGRGAIVATGNIIIGGSIMRHPDDGTYDNMAANWLDEGSNNMLQLIALGTRAPEGDKPTGKIIIAPHKYPPEMFEGGAILGGGVFKDSNDSQIKIDAQLWAKNGFTVSTETRDDKSVWELWGKEDTFVSINGNLIVENTCTPNKDIERDAFETWPDRIMINRYQRWLEILGMQRTENYVNVNLYPMPDMYRITVDGEAASGGATPPPVN